MSFWPFSNPYGSSSQLQKFLDQATDLAAVTAEHLLDDKVLQQELLDELKSISSKSLRGKNLLFVQLLLQETQSKQLAAGNTSDNSSMTSSNADSNGGGSLSKTAREQKLLELLLQPHILHGLLDYIVLSVDFFYEAGRNPQENGNTKTTESTGSKTLYGEEEEVEEEEGQKSAPKLGEEEPRTEKLQRYILCSAEILSTDLWVISNRIIETPSLMGKLWQVISLPNLYESSPALAYLIQILGHLMDLNCIELINFIRKQETLVDMFLDKVDIPILMDFFLKIIQTDKADSPTGILAVLLRQQMIPKLMDILRPPQTQDGSVSQDFDILFRQTAATEFIKALVTISSNPTLAVDLDMNIGPNQLTRELASPQIISIMINEIMLRPIQTKNGSLVNKHGISNCVSILIELIRKNNSDYDTNCGSYTQNTQGEDGAGEINLYSMYLWLKDLDQNPPGPRDPVYLGDLLRMFSDGLPAFMSLMGSEPEPMSLGRGVLGLTKFKIAELIAELLHCSNMVLLNSSKIAFLVGTRDKIRALQVDNIQTALTESITEDSDTTLQPHATHTSHLTDAFDEISLDPPVHEENVAKQKFLEAFENADADYKHRSSVGAYSFEDTEDEEPSVSSENPFVCEERNISFKAKPCVGDYFKIKLIDLHMLQSIVEQLTRYPWHNFFHNVVFDLIQQVFNGKLNSYNSFLIVELFEKCHITDVIVDAFKDVKAPRPGYMGHLVLISEEVVKFASLYKPSLISPIIVDALGSKSWEWFVSDVLLKTRELYNVVLGTDPDYMNEDDVEAGVGNGLGADSSTVHMDQEKNLDLRTNGAIILGDSSNHDEFVSLTPGNHGDIDEAHTDNVESGHEEDVEDIDDENEQGPGRILDVPIKSMSPTVQLENKDMLYEGFEGDKVTLGSDKCLEDLSGSSSSDEEDENQLYRVPRHKS
ncbi:SAPS-domain-containing protein [Metschnikowia bicuspidata var. bicuspidata NRRL YB-4993]|uniref:SAPS-domain-containing protein n=1 Tax=Metschnikowia bicuspidata var. bicuspidata NRRL YB-4993 TaxID=869754 RepID=A0A1A0HEL0_9ASCO|nr:SAPS-domain-containing protein [Metschnikowia bicuspidata var. bicuspidata NRRL YB-4993]OBA22436.1 SAPS-domain-containing protein [Metschnikowia bicuspidata var. bicuspidata NRRL YB-4993]